jgi:5-oxoprolinase (ATP-hydrolysing)
MVKVERMLNMRFDGTDTSLMVLAESDGQEEGQQEKEDFLGAFRKAYKSEFGFLLDEKNVVVDDIKVWCLIH